MLRWQSEKAMSEAPEGWRPIETAPRDCTRVLVALTTSERRIVREARWMSPWDGAPPNACYWGYDGNHTLLDKSVHGIGADFWMPVPEPPVAAENTSQERVLNQAGNEHEPVATVYYPATGGNAGIAWTILKADGVMPPAGAKLYLRPPPLHMPEPMTWEEISDFAREMVKGGKSVDWLARAIEDEVLRRVREANK